MIVPLLLARKDIRMLARTRGLLAMLVLYPLIVAAIVGGVLLQQGPPKIAYVNEDLSGDVVRIGDSEFSVSEYVHRAEKNGVEIVETSREDAERALDEGQVAGVLVIPQGTAAKLQTQLSGAKLEFLVGDNPLGSVVSQRMRGVIYNINLKISDALIDTNREYLDKLVTGGEVTVDGDDFDLYGLAPVEEDLSELRDELEESGADDDVLDQLDRAIEFASDAGTAIGLADNALEATAAPVRLKVERTEGKSPLLTAQAMSFALAVSIAFVCVVLVGASLAGERDEAVLGRLLRGLAHAWQVLVSKLLLGALLAIVFSSGLFVAFGIMEPQAWTRLPLLLAAVTLASLACSSIGALIAVLVRDARTATLGGILLVLPLAPLALVGTTGPVDWIEHSLPVTPSRELFNAVLFDSTPWEAMRVPGLQLLAIALVAGTIASVKLRRLA
jgi:ABC-type multidrug transport system permease subunit